MKGKAIEMGNDTILLLQLINKSNVRYKSLFAESVIFKNNLVEITD